MTEGSTPTPLTIVPCCFRPLPPNGNATDNFLHPDVSTIQRHVPAGDSNVILADLGSGGAPHGTLGRSRVQRYAPSARFPPPQSGQSLQPFLGTGNFPMPPPLAPDAPPANSWQQQEEDPPSERSSSARRTALPSQATRISSGICSDHLSAGQRWNTCSMRLGQPATSPNSFAISSDKELCSVTAMLPTGPPHASAVPRNLT